jgi:antitoxin PrlF
MSILESSSTVTAKGQTTIPLAVRQALGVGPGDKVRFRVLEGGQVEVVRAVDPAETDPVVAAYLKFLESDMLAEPKKLSVLQRDPALQELLVGVEVEDFLLDD